MKHLKENAGNLVMSVCEAVIGVLLLVNPVGFTSLVLIALGAVLAIRGVVNVISYFRAKPEDALRSQSLTAGLLLLAIGLFCMLRFRWLIALFPAPDGLLRRGDPICRIFKDPVDSGLHPFEAAVDRCGDQCGPVPDFRRGDFGKPLFHRSGPLDFCGDLSDR